MENTTIGFCGLNCEECSVFIATKNNDNELRQKTAKEWSGLYSEYLENKNLMPEDINCQGCHSRRDIFFGCKNCVIRDCCKEKQLKTCADCSDYESCDKLNGFFSVPEHKSAKDNLEKIRKNVCNGR